MAQTFPREQFTIPGATPGAPVEIIDMISPTNDIRGQILTFLNGPTTDAGANPSVQKFAVVLRRYEQSSV